QVAHASNSFVFDITPPTSLSTGPVGSVGAVNAITGTASDAAPGGLDKVLVSIYEDQCGGTLCHTGEYWNGVGPGWQPTEFYLASGTIQGACTAGSTCAWSFDASSVLFDNKSTYTVVGRARDLAGNVKAIPGSRDLTFYLETPAPVVAVSAPPQTPPTPIAQYQGSYAGINTLQGTGNNLKLTGGLQISLRRLTEPTSYWSDNTGSWSNDPSTFTPVNVVDGAPQTWSHSLGSPYTVTNASYSLTFTGVNSANQLSVPAVVRTFDVDDVKPIGEFTSPAPATCPGEPAANGCLNAFPTIIGTAIDPGNPHGVATNISEVRVRIQDDQIGTFWDGTGFNAQSGLSDIQTSTSATSVLDWSTATLVSPSLLDGVDYTMYMFGRDRAGNEETNPTNMKQFTFLWDRTPPVAWMINPSSGEVYMNLDSISGTAVDPGGSAGPKFSGVTGVTVQIARETNHICFDGSSAFVVNCAVGDLPATSFSATAPNPWQYANGALTSAVLNGEKYVITVKATDAAGNPQAGAQAVISSRTIAIDKNPPTAGFTIPAQGAAYTPTALDGSQLTGTASDAEAALYKGSDALLDGGVELLVSYLQGGTSYYYNPSACNPAKFCSTAASSASWVTATSTASWSRYIPAGDWVSDRQYRAEVRARDRARLSTGPVVGNLSTPATLGQDIVDFIVDGTPPQTQILSQTDGAFIQDLANVSGTANADLAGATTYFLRITTQAAGSPPSFWNGAAWSATPTSLPVSVVGTSGNVAWSYPGTLLGYAAPTIIEADGTKYGISFQAKDAAGQLSAASTIYVTLDRVGPTVSISTPMGAPNNDYGPQRLLSQFKGNSSDSPAGVAQVRVQVRNLDDNSYWQVGSGGWVVGASSYAVVNGTNPWTMPSPAWTNDKRYEITVEATDNAGNGSPAPQTIPFVYDANKPSSTIVVPSLAFYPSGQPTQLAGTALDNVNLPAQTASGLKQVDVAIQDGSGNYWTGTTAGGFTTGVKWRPAVLSSTSWTYPGAGDQIPSWVDGQSYTVYSRATDGALNVESPGPQQTFTYDATAPTTTVTAPTFAEYVQAVSTISGSYTEAFGLARVQIAVQDTLNNFWNGTGFNSASPVWLDGHVWQSTWSLYSPALNAALQVPATPRNYFLWVAGTDSAGNINRSTQTVWASPGEDGQLWIDHFAPVSLSTYPGLAYQSGRVTPIAGTAADENQGSGMLGVGSMKLKVMRVDSAGTLLFTDGLLGWQAPDPGFNLPVAYFNGGSPGGSVGSWASNAANLPETLFQEGYEYKVASQAQDLSFPHNVEVNVTTVSFVVDRSTPVTSIASPAPTVYVSTNGLSFASGTWTDQFGLGGGIVSSAAFVAVQVQDLSAAPHPAPAAPYWYGSGAGGWQAASTETVSALYQSTWSISALPSDWTHGESCGGGVCADGRVYSLRVRAQDRAGNQGQFPASAQTSQATVVVDVTPPLSWLSYPAVADGGIATSLTSITGTAADVAVNGSSSGVSNVYVSIKRVGGIGSGCTNDGYYWVGASNIFVNTLGTPAWNPATFTPATGVWSYSAPSIDSHLGVDCDYDVVVSAVDNANSAQTAGQAAGQIANRKWTFEPPPAVTSITDPVGQTYNALSPFAGSANADTYKVELEVTRADTGQCWGGDSAMGWVDCVVNVSTAVRQAAVNGGAWSYPTGTDILPPLLDDTTFTLSIRGRNIANLCEGGSCTTFAHAVTYKVDRDSPTSNVTFPSAGFVNIPPTLTGTVCDTPLVGGVCQPAIGGVSAGVKTTDGVSVRIVRSNGDSWDQLGGKWTSSVIFATAAYTQATNSWSFTAVPASVTWTTNESYTVFVKGEDAAAGGVSGNIEDGSAVKASFIYDIAIPTATITSLVRGSTYSAVVVTGTAFDTPPGQLSQVQLTIKDHGTPSNPFIQYWNGTAWTSLISTQASLSGNAWTYSSTPTFADQHLYTIFVAAHDKAGNVQDQTNYVQNGSSFTFYVDQSTPVVAFTNPPGSGYFTNSMGVPAGSVIDPNPGIDAGVHDVTNVKVQVKYIQAG
ncbi:MAG: hypothetical protein KGL53_17125, partial [Elusimicrobia bacterium]|nr:hypothetical protein [Elusimicrobiota bacterium]